MKSKRKHPDMKDSATCVPCSEGTGLLNARQIEEAQALLPSWTFAAGKIVKRYEFKGFGKAVQMANLVAWHSEKMGHHADVAFGWGYCEVSYTSHEAGGLTQNDILCATRLESMVS